MRHQLETNEVKVSEVSLQLQEKHESVDSNNISACQVSYETNHTNTWLQGRKQEDKAVTHQHSKGDMFD